MKHTSGPWDLSYEKDSIWICHKEHIVASMTDVSKANARLIAAAPALENALCDLLEWVKGNRGGKDVNPYGVPEVKQALKLLAEIRGIKDYFDVDTKIERRDEV